MAVAEIKHKATMRKSEDVFASASGEREGSGKASFGVAAILFISQKLERMGPVMAQLLEF